MLLVLRHHLFQSMSVTFPDALLSYLSFFFIFLFPISCSFSVVLLRGYLDSLLFESFKNFHEILNSAGDMQPLLVALRHRQPKQCTAITLFIPPVVRDGYCSHYTDVAERDWRGWGTHLTSCFITKMQMFMSICHKFYQTYVTSFSS